jgi:hypothetical protein
MSREQKNQSQDELVRSIEQIINRHFPDSLSEKR